MISSHRKLERRRFLRGAGGASIALPFLLSRQGDARAQPGVPDRLVTLMFGNGLPPALSANGLAGPLSALAPFADRLLVVRGINAHAQSPNNGHSMGAAAFACGMDTPTINGNGRSVATKGGPSLDWVVHQARGAKTPHAVLCAGVFGTNNDDEAIRRVHSWRAVNQPNPPTHDTLKFFQQIFGDPSPTTVPAAAETPEVRLRARQRVSVLDAVMAEYASITSEASGYSRSVRTLIADHAETVRALELKAIDLHRRTMGEGGSQMPAAGCTTPGAPAQADATKTETLEHWDKIWPVLVDLYVLALRCDVARFGNLIYVAPGDMYPFAGFASAHREVYHAAEDHGQELQMLVKHKLERVAYLLSKLADPAYKEANGGTLLDNTSLFFGTEISETQSHSRTGMTYFLAGGQGRFRRGTIDAKGRSDVDMYNGILTALGINQPFGDMKHFTGPLPVSS